jgi:adenylate cyclase
MKWPQQIRLVAGLVITLYLTGHLIDHAAGIFGVDAMKASAELPKLVWRSWPGLVLLYGSLFAHYLLSLYALWERSTLRIGWGAGFQLALGLLTVPFLVVHIVGTRLNGVLAKAELSYGFMVDLFRAVPEMLVYYALSLVMIWAHACLGLHFWLRLKPVHRRIAPALHAAFAVFPIVSLLGIFRATAASTATSLDAVQLKYPWWTEAQQARVGSLTNGTLGILLLSIVGIFVARAVRTQVRRRVGGYRIEVTNRKTITTGLGNTVLEAMRDAGLPLAAVCGGRGRCTTCRIRVDSADDALAGPSPLEAAALARISAGKAVRLACQLRPRSDVHVTPLLSSHAGPRDANVRGGVSGREQKVTSMFVDLRDSTKLGEDRLPFDVVFILNQFFAEMSAALEATHGHYAQFSGDGLLALYGLEGEVEDGCRNALLGAEEMGRRLAGLNRRMRAELGYELRIGVGIHCGDAIVGTMGPPDSPNLSAIGDNVNIAARLEQLCKSYDAEVVVSAEAAKLAGLRVDDLDSREAEVRGRHEPVTVYALSTIGDLEGR